MFTATLPASDGRSWVCGGFGYGGGGEREERVSCWPFGFRGKPISGFDRFSTEKGWWSEYEYEDEDEGEEGNIGGCRCHFVWAYVVVDA